MLDQNQIIGKWAEIKGGVRNIWGKITEEELDHINCNLLAIPPLVQNKYYDESNESIDQKMSNLMASFDNETDKSLKMKDGESSYQRSPEGFEFDDDKLEFGYDFDEIFDEDDDYRSNPTHH